MADEIRFVTRSVGNDEARIGLDLRILGLRKLLLSYDNLSRGLSDWSVTFYKAAAILSDDLKKNFEEGGRPEPWRLASKQALRHRKESKEEIALTDTGDLMRKVTNIGSLDEENPTQLTGVQEGSRISISWGSLRIGVGLDPEEEDSRPDALRHLRGSRERVKKGPRAGERLEVPRNFMYISEEAREEVTNLFNERIHFLLQETSGQ